MSTPTFTPEQRRASGWIPRLKVLTLWLLLILMFLSIYEIFTGPPVPGPPPSGSFGPGSFVLVGVGAFIAWAVGLVFLQQRNMRLAVIMNGEGIQLLGQGEIEKARALFEAMGEKYRGLRAVRALAQYQVAATLRHAGELEASTARLVALEKSGLLRALPAMQSLSAASLALSYALAADFSAAQPWLAETERTKSTASDQMIVTGSLQLTRAIIACRSGRPAEAVRNLENDWHTLEELKGSLLQPLRLLRAFALAASGGPRDDGAVDRLLAPLRDSRPGSLRYLTVAWPELGVFMDAHHLS